MIVNVRQTAIYTNITQTGRINGILWMDLGRFGWFCVVLGGSMFSQLRNMSQARNIRQMAIYTNITQTGHIMVYCGWIWVVLAGFV